MGELFFFSVDTCTRSLIPSSRLLRTVCGKRTTFQGQNDTEHEGQSVPDLEEIRHVLILASVHLLKNKQQQQKIVNPYSYCVTWLVYYEITYSFAFFVLMFCFLVASSFFFLSPKTWIPTSGPFFLLCLELALHHQSQSFCGQLLPALNLTVPSLQRASQTTLSTVDSPSFSQSFVFLMFETL